MDRRLGVWASLADDPLSVPRQLAALDARTADRLGRLGVRCRLFSERVTRRVDHPAEAVDKLTAIPTTVLLSEPSEAAVQLQVIDGATPSEPGLMSNFSSRRADRSSSTLSEQIQGAIRMAPPVRP